MIKSETFVQHIPFFTYSHHNFHRTNSMSVAIKPCLSQLASATEWKWKIAKTFHKPYRWKLNAIHTKGRTTTYAQDEIHSDSSNILCIWHIHDWVWLRKRKQEKEETNSVTERRGWTTKKKKFHWETEIPAFVRLLLSFEPLFTLWLKQCLISNKIRLKRRRKK